MKKIKYNVKSISNKKLLIKEIFLDINFDKISLKEIIDQIVKKEVNDYNEKIKKSFDNKNFEFNFLILDGKYSFGNIYNDKTIETEKAQKIAILSFKDNLFSIFYGDDELKNLDQIIDLTEDKNFTFIKLSFLSGGYF